MKDTGGCVCVLCRCCAILSGGLKHPWIWVSSGGGGGGLAPVSRRCGGPNDHIRCVAGRGDLMGYGPAGGTPGTPSRAFSTAPRARGMRWSRCRRPLSALQWKKRVSPRHAQPLCGCAFRAHSQFEQDRGVGHKLSER